MNIVFTVDVDNDGVAGDERTSLAWTSLAMIPAVKSIFDELDVPLTWFVRADDQLRAVYGSAAYLLLEHSQIWREFEESGDEIGWHPHLYRWGEEEGVWVPEHDPASCVEQLVSVYTELKKSGRAFTSTRTGEAFHCNETMAAVESFGLRVDSTAIPGRIRNDPSRFFDWSTTPNRPYRPSSDDYRVPGQAARNILEVPMTTVPIQAEYDAAALPRYINPTFHHEIFRAAIDELLASSSFDEQFLVTVFHPDEVQPKPSYHALHAFSLDALRLNVTYLIASLKALGVEYRAIRMLDVVKRAGP